MNNEILLWNLHDKQKIRVTAIDRYWCKKYQANFNSTTSQVILCP